ncbi:proteinase inhibitor i78 [Caulobacter sp. CCUG 60055]|uniref:proteinase inhibitor i78 n=1 Tax=Caulobacter sp. CCUG 60055 TaxID=2100090 RepID=UPI001FA739A3|nr:proteinase inhibitor i78 [Caulobacter sp. CCUG 60055]MBQ1540463.1 proteinase inhibitor i78 [Caulobacteraceae bacterium]MCI3178708.1 proteinase inhibitor i78 [Caulobacter sp. CCUG 60055]
MRPFWLAVAAATTITACSTPPPPVEPQRPAPPPAPAPPPVAPAPVADQCGSAALKYLIGRPKTDIPVPTDPSKRRVLCSSCPATMDYRPDRLNIVYDTQTGIIKEVKCG